MTGPQHYADAQRILQLLRDQTAGELELPVAIQVAQVQATLALAAATALNDGGAGMSTADYQAWSDVAGEVES